MPKEGLYSNQEVQAPEEWPRGCPLTSTHLPRTQAPTYAQGRKEGREREGKSRGRGGKEEVEALKIKSNEKKSNYKLQEKH